MFPVDLLSAISFNGPIFSRKPEFENCAIVAPDLGNCQNWPVKFCQKWSTKPLVIIEKKTGLTLKKTEVVNIIGDIKGRQTDHHR